MFKQTIILAAPVALLCSIMAQTPMQQTQLRVIAFGAHPDDCDGKFSGTAAKFVKAGAAVKFVSVRSCGRQVSNYMDRW